MNRKLTVTPVVLWIVVLLLSCTLVAVVVYRAFGDTSELPPAPTVSPNPIPTVAPTNPPSETEPPVVPVEKKFVLYVTVEYYIKCGIKCNPEIKILKVHEEQQSFLSVLKLKMQKILGFGWTTYNTKIRLILDEHTDGARLVEVNGENITMTALNGFESKHYTKIVAIDDVPAGLHKIRMQLEITGGSIEGRTGSVVTDILVDGVDGS